MSHFTDIFSVVRQLKKKKISIDVKRRNQDTNPLSNKNKKKDITSSFMLLIFSVYEEDADWEVDADNVRLVRELGQGQFGMVYEGVYIDKEKDVEEQVAVKVDCHRKMNTIIHFYFGADLISVISVQECFT